MKSKYYLVARENIFSHPILKIIAKSEKVYESINLKENISCIFLLPFKKMDFIVSDPIVAMFFLHKKFIFFSLEMFEFQVDNNNIKNILRNFVFKICHRIALHKANVIYFPNKIRSDFYVEQYGISRDKIIVLPNYPSRDTIKHIEESQKEFCNSISSELYYRYDLDGIEKYDEIFVYIGTINESNRGLKEIISSVENKNNAFLLLAGKVSSLGDSSNLLKGRKHKYIGELEHKDAINLLNLADYGFLYYSRDLKNTNYCAPVKIFEYINAGVKLVANDCDGLKEYENAIYYNITSEGLLKKNEKYDEEYVDSLKGRFFESHFE
ncbi:hypothetical protein AL546_017575 [Vibrio vulnificus]|uniref:hypothetical protein n=1 Tax=Vibrio vulnificus TaxID=672 RepID=UPI0007357661|nr:hypothetical protein [Vibrio vulnificus]PNM60281.1 hypothetical protein AL546_017575 [Vibrio vulnificus]SUP19137.1 Uncharacterised protein [Vibrio vulnificus]